MSKSLLNFTLSSTLVWEGNSFSAGYCNDGSLASSPWVGSIFNTGAGQICHSSNGDPNPMLVVTYPCSLGLSQVVVTNRQDCCSDRINAFSLEVTDAKDQVAYTYAFALSAPTYTIRIPKTPAPPTPTAPPPAPAGTSCSTTADFGASCGNGVCCRSGQCCSSAGWCGTTVAHCGTGCQKQWSTCN